MILAISTGTGAQLTRPVLASVQYPLVWVSKVLQAQAQSKIGRSPGPGKVEERVRAAGKGDAAALRRILEELGPGVMRTVRALLGKDAPEVDDVVQEALMEIVKALPGFRGESGLPHYANRIVVRTALRARKKSRREGERRGELPEGPGERASLPDEPLDRVAARQRAECLRSLLAELPEAQAEAMTMRLVLGYDLPEISTATGAAINTVRSRVRLGREKLRALIEADPRAKVIFGVET